MANKTSKWGENMAKRHKRRIYSGCVCEQIVYGVSDGASVRDSKPRKPRFADDAERSEFNRKNSERKFAELVNANFGPTSLYSTLTFAVEYEVHTAADCRRERDNYYRRLMRRYPDARIVMVYGEGRTTNRYHIHMVSDGIPANEIASIWQRGSVLDSKPLRKNNYYVNQNGEKINHGQDYTALANYLHGHWRKEFGGHRWKASRTCVRPEPEPATEAVREYSPKHPPVAPKGYILVEARTTKYGYQYYKYVKRPETTKRSGHRLN